MVTDFTTLRSDLLHAAEKLMETMEKETPLDAAQALEHVDCAAVICCQVKGWRWMCQLKLLGIGLSVPMLENAATAAAAELDQWRDHFSKMVCDDFACRCQQRVSHRTIVDLIVD